MTVLDASVLIALMRPDGAHHQAAARIIRQSAITGELMVHSITVAESAFGAAERHRLPQLREAFEKLGIISTPSDAEQPWRLAQLRADTGLAIPDCCVLDLAMQADQPLATFDQRMAAQAMARGVALVVGAR